jgi:hypothetical protein
MKPPSKEEAAALAGAAHADRRREQAAAALPRHGPYWRTDIIDYANMVAKMFPVEQPPAPPCRIKLVGDDGGAKPPSTPLDAATGERCTTCSTTEGWRYAAGRDPRGGAPGRRAALGAGDKQ